MRNVRLLDLRSEVQGEDSVLEVWVLRSRVAGSFLGCTSLLWV